MWVALRVFVYRTYCFTVRTSAVLSASRDMNFKYIVSVYAVNFIMLLKSTFHLFWCTVLFSFCLCMCYICCIIMYYRYVTFKMNIHYSIPVGEQTVAVSLSVCVCLSVCPRVYLWNRWTDLHEILYADPLWPWVGPPLVALQYVMYFRFYVWWEF